MSFADLFDSGFKQRNEDHFAAIVRVAMSDGVITDEERAFLDRLSRNLDISEKDYAAILKNYKLHPINPPSSYSRRLERLYDLARMVWVDDVEGEEQVVILQRLCIGLGFSTKNSKYVTQKALDLVQIGVDGDTFIEEIKNMNQ